MSRSALSPCPTRESFVEFGQGPVLSARNEGAEAVQVYVLYFDVIAGLAVWALESGGTPAAIVLLAVAATAGSILSMASKDRVAALRIPAAPERWIGFLLGGRDARLPLVAIGALIGRPEVVLAAVAITSRLSLAARLLFTRAALRT